MFSKVLSSSAKLPDYVYLNVKKSCNLNNYSNSYIENNGFWLWFQYMTSIIFKKLEDVGIGNIFLLENAISRYGLGKVVSFAKTSINMVLKFISGFAH